MLRDEKDVLQVPASAEVTLTELQAEIRGHKRQHAEQAAKINLVESEINATKRMVQEIYNRMMEGPLLQGLVPPGGNTVSQPVLPLMPPPIFHCHPHSRTVCTPHSKWA